MSLKGDYVRYEISKYRTGLNFGFWLLNIFFGGLPYLIARFIVYNSKFSKIEQLLSDNPIDIQVQDFTPEMKTFALKESFSTKKLNSIYKILENEQDIIWEDINEWYKGEALEAATQSGRFDIVKQMIVSQDYMADISPYYKSLALHAAVQSGRFDIVQEMITNQDYIFGIDHLYKGLALQAATKNGHFQIVQEMITNQDYIFCIDTHYKGLAIETAAQSGRFDIVKQMIVSQDYMADINPYYKGKALQVAAQSERFDIVQEMITNQDYLFGIDTHHKGGALEIAAKSGRFDIVKQMIVSQDYMAGIAPHYKGEPLQAAARSGCFDIVQEMVINQDYMAGIDPYCKGEALEAATQCGHFDIVKQMIVRQDYMAGIYVPQISKVIDLIARDRNKDLIKILFAINQNIEQEFDKYDMQDITSDNSWVAYIAKLIGSNQIYFNDSKLIHSWLFGWLCRNNHLILLKEIIANPNFILGIPPLVIYQFIEFAVNNRNKDLIKILFSINQDIEQEFDKYDMQDIVSDKSYIASIADLVLSDPEYFNISRKTHAWLFMWVAKNNHVNLLEKMIKLSNYMVDINPWYKGQALEVAAENGHFNVVNLLLNNQNFISNIQIDSILKYMLGDGKLYGATIIAQKRTDVPLETLDKCKLNGKIIFNILDKYNDKQLQEIISYLDKFPDVAKKFGIDIEQGITIENLKKIAEEALKKDKMLRKYRAAGQEYCGEENIKDFNSFETVAKKGNITFSFKNEAGEVVTIPHDLSNLISEFVLNNSNKKSFYEWKTRVVEGFKRYESPDLN